MEENELTTELRDALRAELTETTPAPGKDYWTKIDQTLSASVSGGAASKAVPVAKPASRLTKAMMGAAAALLLLVGGAWFLQSSITAESDSVASEAASFDESTDSAEIFDSIAADAVEESAEAEVKRNSLDGAEMADDAAADFATEAESSTATTAALDSLGWLTTLEQGKVLASDEVLSFASSEVDSADGFISPTDFYVYRVVPEISEKLVIVLNAESEDVTFSVYDQAESTVASGEIITELDVVLGDEYFIVIESEADEVLEFALNVTFS